MTEKPTAQVFEASGNKATAPMPMAQGHCFLCGREIGESDPRQFYPKNMMLAHTGCLNKFMANGEVWPQEPEKPAVETMDLGGNVQRVSYGNAKLAFDAHQLILMCNKEIAEQGLKKVIPDLVVALRAALESL